jgi:2-polyprenyl-3-methyl-5-hydroxy-6-metoxy-1,4-benzoquinol methylase
VTPRCPVCGSERFRESLTAFDRTRARKDDYVYARCLGCTLLSRHPPPADHDIASLYPSDYAPHEAEKDARAPGLAARFAASRRFAVDARPGPGLRGRAARTLAGWLQPQWLDPRGENRLLDVGCGAGSWMARYQSLGWEVRGIDPGEAAVEACRARGLPAQQSGLLEADLPSHHFDLILLHHVIEHVLRPVEALRRARELLAPGGAVVVSTPNAGGLGFRWYGSCWYALDAPRHLHLFDAGTLVRTCESAGLSVVSIRSEASARVLASSRHYARTQGPVLPPGHAARAAALARSREQAPSRRFRRAVRPLAAAAASLGYGENLRAVLEDPGRRR